MPSSEVMKKFKKGQLHSGGPNGPIVDDSKQAIAIKMSEQDNEQKHGGTYESGSERKRPARKRTK